MLKVSAAIALAAVAAQATATTVVYDTLSMTENHLQDRATGDCIGAPPDTTDVYDIQIVDDFELEATAVITRVTSDYISNVVAPQNLAAVWVQIFASQADGTPSNEPAADFIALPDHVTITNLGQLEWPSGRPPAYNEGTRISVDLSSQNISLAAGRWWLSMQPVTDESPAWFWILRDFDNVVGIDSHFRNGGVHHTGPFGGGLNVLISPDFDNFAAMGSAGFLEGTIAMRVEAELPCPADFNGSGAVSVQDIFDFLAAYFASIPAADINASGDVSVQDIFDYLALYFSGCT